MADVLPALLAERALRIPAELIYPFMDKWDIQASLLRPFSKRLGFPKSRNFLDVPAVSLLLRFCRPIAIIGAIALVIVAAFDRMFKRRTRTHVGVEVLETIPPTLANADSSVAVILELGATRVDGAILDVRPYMPNRRFAEAVCSWGWPALQSLFMLQTSTRPGESSLQRPVLDQLFAAAIASTKPSRFLALCWTAPNRDQPAESLISHIFRIVRDHLMPAVQLQHFVTIPNPGGLCHE